MSNGYIVNLLASHLLPHLTDKKVVNKTFVVNEHNEYGEEVPVIISQDCEIFRLIFTALRKTDRHFLLDVISRGCDRRITCIGVDRCGSA